MASGAAAAAAGSIAMTIAPNVWLMSGATAMFGVGIGLAMTSAYSTAARVIPAGAHGSGFGVLTSASLTGLAVSPIVAGFLGDPDTMRLVFVLDAVMMTALAFSIHRKMAIDPQPSRSSAR
jgi:MFS family permease